MPLALKASSLALPVASEPLPRHTFPAFFAPLRAFRWFFLLVLLGVTQQPAHAQIPTYYSTSLTRSCVCAGDFDPDFDYFADKVAPTASAGWSVEYRKSYKIVRDAAADVTTILYLCGTPVPADSEFESDISTARTQRVAIPIRRGGVDTSTAIPYFEYLAQRDSLSFYRASFDLVTSACLQRQHNESVTLDLDAGVSLVSNTANIDFFWLSKYNFDFPAFAFPPIPQGYTETPNVPFFVDAASAEPSPLGQAEWVKLYSLFFNRERAANDVFGSIKARYECRAAEVAAALAGGASRTKLAAFQIPFIGRYGTADAVTCDGFNASTVVEEYALRDCPTVDCTLIADAGGELLGEANALLAANNNSVTVGALMAAIADAEVIIYEDDLTAIKPGCLPKLQEMLNETAAGRAQQIFDNYKTASADGIGSDIFEGKVAEPDVALLDYISILHPSLAGTHKRGFFRKAFGTDAEDIVRESAEDCEDVQAPLFNDWKKTPCDVGSEEVEIRGVDPVSFSETCADPKNPPSSAVLLKGSAFVAAMLAGISLLL